MHRTIGALEHAAKQGGRVGAKAAMELQKARIAYAVATAEFASERAKVQAAQGVLGEYKAAQSGFRGWAGARAGEAAMRLEAALSSSRIGSKLLTAGRIVSSKTFVNSLVYVGAALEGVASYADSVAETQAGKIANAALGAGSGALTMLNPYVAIGDVLAPKGYKLSELYHGGAGAVTALGEAVFRYDRTKEGVLIFDTRPLDAFHQRSMEGDYGKVLQAASEAGEYWADKGISGGLLEFADSVKWWLSH
jgi:hypothetical protein